RQGATVPHTSAPRSRRSRRGAVLALTAALALAPTLGSISAAATEAGPTDKLGAHDRALIAQYAAQYRSRAPMVSADGNVLPAPDTVTLLIAARTGTTAAVVEQLVALGAEITKSTPEVDFITATVPFSAVDAVVALPDVERIDADELHPLEDPA